jgi:hypothetical protein
MPLIQVNVEDDLISPGTALYDLPLRCTPSSHLLLHVLQHTEARSRHLYILAPNPVHTDSTRRRLRKGSPLLAEASECRLSIDAGGTSLKGWCDISPSDRAVSDRQHMAGSESCCSEDATSCRVGAVDKQANGSSRGKTLGHRIFAANHRGYVN